MAGQQILVFGKSGQIGSALSALLGHKVYTAGRDEADFTSLSSLEAVIEKVKPRAIINAVAYTQVDKAESEPSLAWQVNAEAPAFLATLARQHDIPFVHYSTDYVFDGSGVMPHRETEATAPLNVYGKSKREGEEGIISQGGDYLIFRTSWVFDAQGKNFLNTMLRLGAERESLSIVADQHGAPSYAPHLAEATIEALLEATHQETFPSGIYHLCNAGETTWHGFASFIFEEASRKGMALKVKNCQPIATKDYPTPAIRPLNSRLDCSKMEQIFGIRLPDWKEGVREALKEKVKGL